MPPRRATIDRPAPSVAEALRAAHPRPAGSDAERRLAGDVAAALRAGGRRTDVRTVWFRGGDAAIGALHALLGVGASLAGVHHPVVGAAVAGGALLSLLLDAGGRVRPLRRLVRARATQVVVSPAPKTSGAGAIDLLVAVRTDVPRRGLADRGRLGRAALGPERVCAAGLLAVAAVCGGRTAGASGSTIDVAQLAATLALLLAGAALVDRALARRTDADGAAADAAVRAALALVAALDRAPARRLAVTVVCCGAGPETLRGVLRAQHQAGVRPEEVAVLELAPAPGGRPVWWRSDGRVLPLRFHPTLLTAAAQAAAASPALAATPRRGAGDSLARAARGLRRPAIALGVPVSGRAGTAFAEAVVRALDGCIAAAAPDRPTPTAPDRSRLP